MVSYHKESAGRYLSVVKTRKFNRINVSRLSCFTAVALQLHFIIQTACMHRLFIFLTRHLAII